MEFSRPNGRIMVQQQKCQGHYEAIQHDKVHGRWRIFNGRPETVLQSVVVLGNSTSATGFLPAAKQVLRYLKRSILILGWSTVVTWMLIGPIVRTIANRLLVTFSCTLDHLLVEMRGSKKPWRYHHMALT